MAKPRFDKKAVRRFACGEIAALIQQALDAGAWEEAHDAPPEFIEAVQAEMRKEVMRFHVWSNRPLARGGSR